MPATEQTWRDQKLLHIAFGVSGLVLLISTIWMLAADHGREWKQYQRKGRTAERTVTDWRLRQEQSDVQSELERLSAKKLTARSQAVPQALYDAFKDEVRSVQEDYRFDRLDEYHAELEDLASQAQNARGASDAARADAEEKVAAAAAAQEALEAVSEGEDEARKKAEADLELARTASAEAAELLEEKQQEAEQAEIAAAARRDDLTQAMTAIIERARFREDKLLGDRKFKAADYDAARATLDLAVRDEREQSVQDQLQSQLDDLKTELDVLTLEYQDAADYRKRLDDVVARISASIVAVDEELATASENLDRLETTLKERQATYFTSSFPFLGKRILELPIVDAFNSPLKIDNLWTENLTITNGSFGQVRRFDRCTTCHKAIDQTQPGSAVEPAYETERVLRFALSSPTAPPDAGQELTLEDLYGFSLAPYGLLADDAVTIDVVRPNTLAANAVPEVDAQSTNASTMGLRSGDIIERINDTQIIEPAQVRRMLLQSVQWGQTLYLGVRRGVPHPYASHPRLDLFVGSLSPHPLPIVGCSVCHEGQGSATEFKWASHAPDNQRQARQWSREYGWFNNHHWIYPMFPKRFAESACLKCHHEVTELLPSARFPDPPAPKVTKGHQLVKEFGCYGCHEINGYDGQIRIGPDLRLEPNYFAAAAQIKSDPAFDEMPDEVRDWTRQLFMHPDRDNVRHRLKEFVDADKNAEAPKLTARSHKMGDVLDDVETPGKLPKAGPTLRYIKQKVGKEFLFDWIREPKHFRATTNMPQFFGQWDHLGEEPAALETSKKFEPIEVLGVVTYLLNKSQSWEYLEPAEGITESTHEEKAARGKELFELRGCLACHTHKDFPGHVATQGPDLSNVGDKFSSAGTPNARAWLYSWLKSPANYHSRTQMPNLFLDPIKHEDGTVTDPAADITEFLLSSTDDWSVAEDTKLLLEIDDDAELEALDELALEHLGKTFFLKQAQRYLREGIPEEIMEELKGDEVELVGAMSTEKKLTYVGRRTISKFGCYGCHDIPGFEDAKPIGTSLADWGRKDASKIAFEHIVEYLGHGHGHGEGSHAEGGHDEVVSHEEGPGHDVAGLEADHSDTEYDDEDQDSLDFYHQRLHEHERAGFIWQKLREPRSFDYRKTTNKDYNERLRMPKFPFHAEDREAVITFVLGLVAEPPAPEFIFRPDARTEALVAGRQVLDKYNCGGCHILEPERWVIEHEPGQYEMPAARPDFPFVQPHFTPEEFASASEAEPFRGMLSATLHGMPAVNDADGTPLVLDDEGDPVEEGYEYDPATLQYVFDLWKPTILDGQARGVGVLPISVPASRLKQRNPPLGGDLTFRLFRRVIEIEQQANPAAKGTEAWGWLPPPLIGQGTKTQPDWLHAFLLDPHPIRPAVFLRMPKFNMSPEEATKIVNYFTARDNAVYPFEFNDRARNSHLAAAEDAFRQRMGDALDEDDPGDYLHLKQSMNIVTDANYCVKCHLVGDFDPTGSDRAKAPNLSMAHRRLRPEFVRKWVANPKSILPYTSMPVNVPYDPSAEHEGGVSQELYPGTSTQQIDALVDLLTNFDRYTLARSPVAPLVKPATEASATTAVSVESASSAEGGE